jgi:hypothetical protein
LNGARYGRKSWEDNQRFFQLCSHAAGQSSLTRKTKDARELNNVAASLGLRRVPSLAGGHEIKKHPDQLAYRSYLLILEKTNMRSLTTSSQSHKNSLQKLLFMALLLLAPIIGRADEFDDQKNQLQILIDQANTIRDNLGPDSVKALSKGGAEFVLLGDKADLLMGALDAARLANNPLESEDFISRLAGSTTSDESVAWCGENAIVGFNDSGSFLRTMFPPSPSPSGSFSHVGWSVSTDRGGSFSDRGILLPDLLPSGVLKMILRGDPVPIARPFIMPRSPRKLAPVRSPTPSRCPSPSMEEPALAG